MTMTSVSARGHLPVNMVKPPFQSDKRKGLYPKRTRKEDHTSVYKHTVAIIDMGHQQTNSEINNKIIEGITDLAGHGGMYSTTEEFENNTMFGGIVTRNALDGVSFDATFAATGGGQVSIINTGDEPIHAGEYVRYALPKHDNPRYFMDNPDAPAISFFDKHSPAHDIPPGKILVQTLPWRAERDAINVDSIFDSGIKPGTRLTGAGKLFHEYEKDSTVFTLLHAYESGLARPVPIAQRRQVGAQFRQAHAINPGQVPNNRYEMLVNSLYQGVSRGTQPGFFIPNKGRLTRVSLRSKFARRSEDLVFRKKKDNKARRRKLVARQRNIMTRFTSGLATKFEKARSFVFGKMMTTTAPGGLGDILVRPT